MHAHHRRIAHRRNAARRRRCAACSICRPRRPSRLQWDVDLPLDERPWHIGLIVGPVRAAARRTIARHLWPRRRADRQRADLAERRSHPRRLSRDAVDQGRDRLCCRRSASRRRRPGCGPFTCSRPASSSASRWPGCSPSAGPPDGRADRLRRIHQRRRSHRRPDRQRGPGAGRCASRGLQFVAVTCHEDVERLAAARLGVSAGARTLSPGGVFGDARAIALDVVRCQASAWPLFAPHHYLSSGLQPSAPSASWRPGDDRPVAFSRLAAVRRRRAAARREHRTVTLPDYQGVGIGNALSAVIASHVEGARLPGHLARRRIRP